MSSGIKKLKLNSTPNSAKLAEILLQLKDESLPTVVVSPPSMDDDDEPEVSEGRIGNETSNFSTQDNTNVDTRLNDEEDEIGHTLPASEACNCRKSRCLKLYCQCFAGKAICGQFCRCLQCDNRTVNGGARMAAINAVLERNPNAFESKYKTNIVAAESDVAPIAHKNGCRCRKSLCLKKYCECFQGGVHCSNICTCLVCYNRNGSGGIVSRVNSLQGMEIPSNSHAVLEQIASIGSKEIVGHQLLLKRSLSEASSTTFENEDSAEYQNSNQDSPSSHELDALNGQRPPLGPQSKKKKLSPSSADGSFDIRATPSSSAAALLSLNPGLMGNVPGTPSTIVHLPLRVESTPFTIRSASPNSLSIAKALSLLGGNCTLAQALNFANALEGNGNLTIEIKEVKTPLNDDSQPTTVSSSSTNSKSSISTNVDELNSSIELTDVESDVNEAAIRKKLDYEERIQIQVFPHSLEQV